MNLILLSGLEINKLWDIVKDYRHRYLIENIDIVNTLHMCFNYDSSTLYTESYIISTIDAIEIELKLLGSQHDNYDIEKLYLYEMEFYGAAAEMFIYLNNCPKFMFDWTLLFTKLFQNSSPNIIVQTLNRIMLTGKMKGDNTIMNISKQIFMKVTDMFSLEFQTIDRITKGISNDSVDRNGKFDEISQHNIGKI